MELVVCKERRVDLAWFDLEGLLEGVVDMEEEDEYAGAGIVGCSRQLIAAVRRDSSVRSNIACVYSSDAVLVF